MRSISAPDRRRRGAGGVREHDLHVLRPDGHRSDHRDRARRDRRRDARREGGRDESSRPASLARPSPAPTVNTSFRCSLSASTWSPGNRRGSRRRSTSAVALTVDQIQRVDMLLDRRERERDRRSPSERAHRSTPAAPSVGPHDHREAGHGSAAQRSQLSAAAVPRRRRRGDSRRAGRRCGRAWAMRSASWAPARRRTTS